MKTELTQDERAQVAIHEAGHFVVADELGLPVDSVTTIQDTAKGYYGQVCIALCDAAGQHISVMESDRDTQVNWLACYYAGELAQFIRTPELANNWRNWFVHPEEQKLAALLAAHICKVDLAIAEDCTDSEELEALTKATIELEQQQKKRAQDILEARKKETRSLATALEPPCTLSACEARSATNRMDTIAE